MIVRALQKNVRITPRKLRAVADLVRGRELPEINDMLSTLNLRGARVVNETIRQAVANAVNNLGHDETTLELRTIMINEGPTYKRFRAGARGRAKAYEKKTSHILVELNVDVPDQEPVAPVKKAAKPAKAEAVAQAEVVETAEKASKPATKKPVKSVKKTTAADGETSADSKAPATKPAKKAAAAKTAATKKQ